MLASRLKGLRKDMRITQAWLADRLGVTQQAVAKWEAGKSFPESEVLLELSRYFDVTIDYLMGVADRSVRPDDEPLGVPVLGSVRAGYNSLAFDDPQGTEPIGLRDPQNYCYLIVQGDSMEPYIHEGDLALVRRQQVLENGDLGVVIYGEGEGTLKRYRVRGRRVLLEPFNPAYETVEVSGTDLDRLHIFGKVVETKTRW